MTNPRTKIIACATVFEEMQPLLSPEVAYEVLDFGLHLTPDKLRGALQERIDAAAVEADIVILGYGLCSMALAGLKANDCTLVAPRVDDCIAIFLGSHDEYKEQIAREPGTYYLTKGWIEVGDTPFDEFGKLVERYGQERADRMMQVMLRNYKRLAYIDTGRFDQERCRDYAARTAAQFGLRYEEIAGSNVLVNKLIFGPWDSDFLVIPPGDTITYLHFRQAGVSGSSGQFATIGPPTGVRS